MEKWSKRDKTKKDGITTYRVGKDYRKNELSIQDGGHTVCVKYVGGWVKEYNNVKRPWAYMYSIEKSDEFKKILKMWIKESE